MDNFIEQWRPVNMEFLQEFLKLHNQVCFQKKTQEDFNKFVLDNKEKFDNPDYLQVFAENVEIFDEDYYKTNFEMCKVFYDFMENNPDWIKLPFGLRPAIRLGTFHEEFKKLIDEQ